MIFNVNPLRGVGDVEFGMHIDNVRSIISEKFEIFNRISYPEDLKDAHPADNFFEIGIFCYYDRDGFLEAMEFSGPAKPLLGGVDMLGIPFGKADSILSNLDDNLIRDLNSVISRRWSLAILKPDRRADPADTFLAGKAGLYEGLD